MKIAVVDYGVGNLASVSKSIASAGATPSRVMRPAEMDGSNAIVIPGVGHFAATAALDADWRVAIAEAISRGVPVLGICLGMQWLFDGSQEANTMLGLGALPGTCSMLPGSVKVPHVGWNSLERTGRPSALLDGVAGNAAAYFTHSYAAPVTDDAVATTAHGQTFASVVERGSVFGVQWHPEKSGAVGLRLLSNFAAIARRAAC